MTTAAADSPKSTNTDAPAPSSVSPETTITSASLYVGNLPYSTRWQELKDHFNQAGDVMFADIPKDYQSGRPRGYGIVKFETVEVARRAFDMFNGTDFGGRQLVIRDDLQPQHQNNNAGGGRSGGQQQRQQPVREKSFENEVKLFVGNLDWGVSWQELKDFAKSLGLNPIRSNVATSYGGKSRGWGTLSFANADEANNAVEALNGQEIKGRIIEVREDRKPETRN